MKTKGVIRGTIIELQALTDFPDGQEVAVEISLLTAQGAATGTSSHAGSNLMKAADELRRSIAERVGGNLDSSVEYIR